MSLNFQELSNRCKFHPFKTKVDSENSIVEGEFLTLKRPITDWASNSWTLDPHVLASNSTDFLIKFGFDTRYYNKTVCWELGLRAFVPTPESTEWESRISLQAYSDLMALFFTIDNLSDSHKVPADIFLEPGCGAMNGLDDIVGRIKPEANAKAARREFLDWIRVIGRESEFGKEHQARVCDREGCACRSSAEYRTTYMHSVGYLPCHAFLVGEDQSSYVLEVTWLLRLANDIVSLYKSVAAREDILALNVVVIIKNELGLTSMEEAMEQSIARFNTDFKQLIESMTADHDYSEHAKRVCLSWVAANVDWSFSNGHYAAMWIENEQ